MSKVKRLSVSYQWEGIDRDGEKIKGIMDASSIAIVKADLGKQGIIIKKVQKKYNPFFYLPNKKITHGDITNFNRQLVTLLGAGIPLIQSFSIVIKGQGKGQMRNLLSTIKNDVETGLTLAESLSKHPQYFNKLFCNLVAAGEKSGSLEIMLEKVASHKEKIESIKKKIKRTLAYPITVMIVAFIVTTALFTVVVPQFESLFKGFNADLPALTRTVVDLSAFFQSYWYIIFGALGGAVYGFIHAKNHSPKVAQAVDRALLKFPVLGNIFAKAAIARFARTLSITFAAGLPLVDALTFVAGATGNILYTQATHKIREQVSTGQQLQLAMDSTHLFPNMVVQLVAIGEESGSLEQMLSKVADIYEEEVDHAVDALSSLLEPIIMSILGILVGGLVVAMYLPIIKLGTAV